MPVRELLYKIAATGAPETAGGLNNVSKAFDGITGAATLAIAKFGVLQQAASQIIGTITDVADRAEGLSAAYNSMSGSIDETVKRINGAATSLDLVTSKNRAAQAGLELTDHQFANVAVAAEGFADATGGTTAAAIEQLSSGIIALNERSLRQFGIHIDSSKSRSENFKDAMAQLEARVGTASAGVDTAAGKIEQLKNKMTDAADGFLKGVTGSKAFNAALDELIPNVGSATDDIGTKFTKLGIKFAAAFESMIKNLKSFGTLFTDVFSLDPAKVVGAIDRFNARSADIAALNQKRVAEGNAGLEADRKRREAADAMAKGIAPEEGGKGTKKTGGGAANDNGMFGLEVQEKLREAAFNRDMRRFDERQAAIDKEKEAIDLRTVTQIEAWKAEDAAFEEKQAKFEKAQDKVRTLVRNNQIDMQRNIDRTRDKIEQQGEATRDAANMIGNAYAMVLTGQMSFGEAIMKQLDAYLIKTAREQAIEAIVNTAKGIASLASFNYPSAGQFFAAAGINAAAAAAAGGASLAIPGGGAGAGAGGFGGTSASPAQFGNTPANNNQGGNTYVVNVSMLTPNADSGRVIMQSMKDAQRKFGMAA
jgi:hypothetical protein